MGALLFHGDFCKAAVSYAGCHDNRMDKIWWNEQWMGWPLGPQYARASNVDNASKLQGDLLLVVGELDTNVDPASTLQVVSALIRADKQFDLLVVPGENHGARAIGHLRVVRSAQAVRFLRRTPDGGEAAEVEHAAAQADHHAAVRWS